VLAHVNVPIRMSALRSGHLPPWATGRMHSPPRGVTRCDAAYCQIALDVCYYYSYY